MIPCPFLSYTLSWETLEIMEHAMSAITGDLASRFISFLINKCSNHACSEEKVERLEQLLLRVHAVMEEADGRRITNSRMLIQLKTLAVAMYRGYQVLDTIMYRQHKEFTKEELVSDSVSPPLKRSCTINRTDLAKLFNLDLQFPGSILELQSALRNLESVVTNMTEFVILLGGCERISRKPYDNYLYMDNCMFGRHVEKQRLINFLLHHDAPGPPAVLPVIGSRAVGKKTLVAHVCNDERVRSHFSSVLHFTRDDICRLADHEKLSGRILVVLDSVLDIDDNDWTAFYSSVTSMSRGSKVIGLSRNGKLEKYGTVKPIFLSSLAYEEYRYLFKTLAFGSVDPVDHPRLVPIAEEFAMVLGGSLVSANVVGHVLRKNMDAHFWLSKLNNIRATVKKNMSSFGLHPQVLFDQGHPVHLKGHFLLSPAAPTRLLPSVRGKANVISGEWLASAGLVVPPEGGFTLISWESRLPPYTSYVHSIHYAPGHVDDKPETPLLEKKRPRPFL